MFEAGSIKPTNKHKKQNYVEIFEKTGFSNVVEAKPLISPSTLQCCVKV